MKHYPAIQFATFLLSFLIILVNPVAASNKVPEAVSQELFKAAGVADGNLLYLDFWASWCGPCRKSFPWMNEMQKKYQQHGLKILAVNVDKEKKLAEEFLKQQPASFSIFYDPDGRMAETFKLQGMPSSYLIDHKGNILKAQKGFFLNKTDTYEKQLKEFLKLTD